MLIKTLKLWEGRDDVELTTFIAMPDPVFPDNKKRPAVIVCAGGSYMTCTRHSPEGDNVAAVFAADGYQAFVLEYSIHDRAPEGKALFPAQILDYGKAILTIREHADEWNVDVNRISIIGFSAGAHLCGMIATTWHEKLLTDYFHTDSEVFKPLCAMLIYPITDFHIQNEHLKKVNIPVYPKESNIAVFGCLDPSEEQEREYSPVCHVSEKTCPVFIAAAANDSLVPAIQSIKMAEALNNAGVSYELHLFELGDHGFALGRYIPEPYREDKKHADSKWLEMSKKFLMHQVAEETTHYEKHPFGDFI
ncbi:MAG: alpha/beta hydrolase [Lachnospiraceae bacterium]|nr:alpha/beta hydrolase [Lachnospiraceae bacterium]